MTKEEMQWHNEHVLLPNEAFKEAQRRTDQTARGFYSQEELQGIQRAYGLDTPSLISSPAKYDTHLVLTIDAQLQKAIKDMLQANEARGVSGLTSADVVQLHHQAEEMIKTKYVPFKAPGSNSRARGLVQERLANTRRLIQEAGLTASQEHLLFEAVGHNQVNLAWKFTNVQEIQTLINQLQGNGTIEDEWAKPFINEFKSFQEQLDRLEEEYKTEEKDGRPLFLREFLSDLAHELQSIRDIQEVIRQRINETTGLLQSEHQENFKQLGIIYQMLEAVPSPEEFSYGHFIYRLDDYYKTINQTYGRPLLESSYEKHFTPMMRALEKAVEEGALVDCTLFGGMGTRAFNGKVKGAVPFQMGDESETTFLKLAIRNWAAFLAKFPSKRKAISNIFVSAFTEDAIKAVYQQYLKETGLDSRTVGVVAQSLRQVVRPTEMELSLQLALQVTTTEEQRKELMRQYEWYISTTNEELKRQETQDPRLVRPVYRDEGLNPLNAYAPSGHGSSLEAILSEENPVYTLKNLTQMGYEFDEQRLAVLVNNKGREHLEQKGMTLAEASLIVKGRGLSIAVIRNGTGFAQYGGGDLNLGKAVQDIFDNPDRLAVVQYANVAAGSDVGGVLVRKKNSDGSPGAVTTLESQRIQFAEGAIFEEDLVSITTGVVVTNLKVVWKILGESRGVFTSHRTTKKRKSDRIHEP
ncbi:MAG: hypothetical protein HQL13_08645 [Candidatus Omnitrophica bacterium]|nr:hypothetical protein [Candidatus Omnitrophota bacterium]